MPDPLTQEWTNVLLFVDNEQVCQPVDCMGSLISLWPPASTGPTPYQTPALQYEKLVVTAPLETFAGRPPANVRWLIDPFQQTEKLCSLAVKSRTEYVKTLRRFSAYVQKVTWPSLDVLNEDVVHLAIELVPTSYEPISEAPSQPTPTTVFRRRYPWLRCRFELAIDGLPAEHVFGIAEFSQAQNESSSITLTMPLADWSPWIQWHDRSLLERRDQYRNGELTLHDSVDANTFQISMHNLAIRRIDAPVNRSSAWSAFSVELSCQRLEW